MTATTRRSLRSATSSASTSLSTPYKSNPPSHPHPHLHPRKTGSNKLRPVSPEELEAWPDSDATTTTTTSLSTTGSDSDLQPADLDEPWPYTFRPGESVWVRTAGGNWYPGKISGHTTRKGQTREKEGLYYPAIFCDKLRKYFAPLNGEIKPDTVHVRGLLKNGGWM